MDHDTLHNCNADPTQIHVKTQSIVAITEASIKNDSVPNSNAVIDSSKGIENRSSKLQITTAADKLTATWNELITSAIEGIVFA